MLHRLLPLPVLASLALAACSHGAPSSNEIAFAAPSAPAVSARSPSNLSAEEGRAVQDNHIDVPFTNGSAQLTPEAEAKLDLAARLFRDAGPALMFSAGCADATGTEYDNLVLSARRADVVKQALAARGIPGDRVQLRAYGESELAVPADPNSAANRRVMITWRMT